MFRLGGMIYWYAIGDIHFDIRDMRRMANFHKDDYAADHDHQNPLKGLALVAQQWDIILQKHESYAEFFNQFGVANYRVKTNNEDIPF